MIPELGGLWATTSFACGRFAAFGVRREVGKYMGNLFARVKR